MPGCDGVVLLGAETQLRGSNLYGEVTGGFLRVKGALLKVQLDIMPAAPVSTWETTPLYNFTVLSTGDDILKELEEIVKEEKSVGKIIRFYPDTLLELRPNIESTHLPIEKSYQRSSRSKESAIEPMSGVAYCLRFLSKPLPSISSTTTSVWLLVLSCVDKETQIYERIGLIYLGMVEENSQFFLEMEPQVLTIV